MTRMFSLGVAIAMVASPAIAQTANENDREDIPARNDVSVEKMLERADHDRMDARSNDRVSRVALEQWAGCIARANAAETTRVLTMDFTAPTYGRAMLLLSQESKSCFKFRGTLKAAGLLFAGELAEALLERPGDPLLTRLVQAAGGPATQSFSFTDKVAICTVRSAPNDVAQLFTTERDSEQEAAALQAISNTMGMCARVAEARKPLSINPAGLRAMLATATFRTLEAAKDA